MSTNPKKLKPTAFIGSSVEALSVAHAIQENLEYSANTVPWDQGVFDLSAYTLDSLIKIANEVDFAIFAFTPDDVVKIRKHRYRVARDNVIFELGLFVGRLSRERVFIIAPRNIDKQHFPTDLLGLTLTTYDPDNAENLIAAVGTSCNKIRRQMERVGLKNHRSIGPPVLSDDDSRLQASKAVDNFSQFKLTEGLPVVVHFTPEKSSIKRDLIRAELATVMVENVGRTDAEECEATFILFAENSQIPQHMQGLPWLTFGPNPTVLPVRKTIRRGEMARLMLFGVRLPFRHNDELFLLNGPGEWTGVGTRKGTGMQGILRVVSKNGASFAEYPWQTSFDGDDCLKVKFKRGIDFRLPRHEIVA